MMSEPAVMAATHLMNFADEAAEDNSIVGIGVAADSKIDL